MSTPQNRKRIVLVGMTPGSAREPRANPISDHRYVYLLSPANAAARRAAMLLNPSAEFDLAKRLRTTGIPLGEAFTFMSSLYFRGKLAYTAAFSHSSESVPGTLIITPSGGLLAPETNVTLRDLAALSGGRISATNPRYRDPLERDLRTLTQTLDIDHRVVLLGSIATRKYVPLLLEIFGERLLVPRVFIGLGNMSRGALLLRCSRNKNPLAYVPIAHVLANKTN